MTNDGRTVEVTIQYTDFLAGTAHPIEYVTTTVIDVASATPLRLSDVFPDQPAAFRALRPEIIKAARRKNEDITDSGVWRQTRRTGLPGRRHQPR